MLNHTQTDTKIEFANTLRGIAALIVVFSHYGSVFWYKRDVVAQLINAPILNLESYNSPTYVLWLNKLTLFDWGSYGVGLFFLISGFVIPFSLHRINSVDFLIHRFFRIVPTYVVGFSITLFALFIGTQYFMISWPYSSQELFIHYLLGIRDLMGSKNIDSIIWTLEVEIKFYVLMALSRFWFHRYSLKVFLIPVVLFVLNCYLSYRLPTWALSNFTAFIWSGVYLLPAQYIIFMFLGVAFHYLYTHQLEPNQGYLVVALLFFLFCISWWIGPDAGSIILSWSYALAVLTFMFAATFPYFFRTNPVLKFFADISYPLYTIHCIFGYVFLRILLDNGFNTELSLVLVSVIVTMLSWFLHVVIEQPIQLLGKKLKIGVNLQYLKNTITQNNWN